MITIGQRVKYAIDSDNRGEFLLGLEQVAIAIDMTAKKYYGANSSSANNYKNLLKEYSWLLELIAFNGINLDESKFGNFYFKANNKEFKEPTLQEIIYHIVRCGLIHGDQLSQLIRFHKSDTIFLGKDILILPTRILWGLLGIVVFCSVNKNEVTTDGYWLSIFDQNYPINISWGIESCIKASYYEYIKNCPRIALNIEHDRVYGTKNLD